MSVVLPEKRTVVLAQQGTLFFKVDGEVSNPPTLFSIHSSPEDDTVYLLLNLPQDLAASMHSLEPLRLIIWAIAVRSSWARKNGYRPLRMHRRITPVDHMSTAVVWLGHLSRTSGVKIICEWI